MLLGDSSALGVGVDRLEDTIGGQLANLLAEGPTGRRVHLSSVGVSGSRSTDLATQVARALLGERPDVALILIGANDATGLRRPVDAAAYLAAAVHRLREARVEVVVGTCPDLGAVRAIAPPLRQVVGWSGRRMARAQTTAVLDAGGSVVDLGTETGPVFRADAGTLCHDGFHPPPTVTGCGRTRCCPPSPPPRRSPPGARSFPVRVTFPAAPASSAHVTGGLTLVHAD